MLATIGAVTTIFLVLKFLSGSSLSLPMLGYWFWFCNFLL